MQVTEGVNAVDRRGDSAMHGAAYKNLPAVVEWLGEHGADPSLWLEPNKQGWSPLQIAEGFRPGNYKPSPETVAAIHAQLRAAGLQIPPPTPRRVLDKRKGYDR